MTRSRLQLISASVCVGAATVVALGILVNVVWLGVPLTRWHLITLAADVYVLIYNLLLLTRFRIRDD